MRVLLLGGTGAMGKPLSSILLKKGYELYITTRRNLISSDNRLKYITGDAHDVSFLNRILKGTQYDAIVDFMAYSISEFSGKYEMLLNSTKQYIFVSSARVFDDSEELITENSKRLFDTTNDKKYLFSDEYAISKAKSENLLMSYHPERWTIIRPYITYNDERLQLGTLEKEEWLYRAINGKSILFSRDIAGKKTTLTSGYDVADCISRMIGNIETFGEVYNVVSQESIEWEKVLEIYTREIKKITGIIPNVKWVDSFYDMGIHTYQAKYDRMFNRRFDNSKLFKHLHKSEFISVETGLQSCINSFLQNQVFRGISWKRIGISDHVCKEYTDLSLIKNGKDKMRYLAYRIAPIIKKKDLY